MRDRPLEPAVGAPPQPAQRELGLEEALALLRDRSRASPAYVRSAPLGPLIPKNTAYRKSMLI